MSQTETLESLRWKKFPVGSEGFICLVDWMGSDDDIVSAARVSYGKGTKKVQDDRNLIRYLYRHGHGTPFEMVEIKFLVRVPMDIWRQWIRHRTANVNEYSTRYSEAIDGCAKAGGVWRAQSKSNKQGSIGLVEDWPEGFEIPTYIREDIREDLFAKGPSAYLDWRESTVHDTTREIYEERLKFGVAKEQARKDLPLSNYTEAYWKCDLRNILGFLSLRMDSHAQLEIRQFANAMYEIVKAVCPLAVEAFDEYDMRRGGLLLTRTEVNILADLFYWMDMSDAIAPGWVKESINKIGGYPEKSRERDECIAKFKRLGLLPEGTRESA
jgi:thymidylate synthase (FAD)